MLLAENPQVLIRMWGSHRDGHLRIGNFALQFVPIGQLAAPREDLAEVVNQHDVAANIFDFGVNGIPAIRRNGQAVKHPPADGINWT